MLFIELFAPKGALSEEQRRHLSGRLVTEVMNAPDAPDALTGAIEPSPRRSCTSRTRGA